MACLTGDAGFSAAAAKPSIASLPSGAMKAAARSRAFPAASPLIRRFSAMNRRLLLATKAPALLLATWLTVGVTGSALATPWAQVKAPSEGPTKAIGGVANGCIAGAQPLPAEGDGYVSIRRYRNRFYGHADLLHLVSDLAREQARHGPGLVMIGDLSQPRGGLMSSSHRSHQNGLDVDIWFQRASSAATANLDTANRPDPPSMVTPDGEGLSPLWGDDQQALLKAAAVDPRVDRIFVNAAIKRELCASDGDKAWLHKLRPWFGHDAHFHIRLRCPHDSSECKQQAAIPTGDGCGTELDWWFSAEARTPAKKGAAPTPRAEPATLAACQPLLSTN
jgi:penicillin-insensitive murein endopeptidase